MEHTAQQVRYPYRLSWRTFVWNSETAGKAHVHCVIVGFSIGGGEGLIFDGGEATGLLLAEKTW